MSKTFALDIDTWDLILDANGNIGIATEPYQIAQDVACVQRVFLGEMIMAQEQGIPYDSLILGKTPPRQLVETLLQDEALRVPEVVKAVTTITSSDGGNISGNTKILDAEGQELNVRI